MWESGYFSEKEEHPLFFVFFARKSEKYRKMEKSGGGEVDKTAKEAYN